MTKCNMNLNVTIEMPRTKTSVYLASLHTNNKLKFGSGYEKIFIGKKHLCVDKTWDVTLSLKHTASKLCSKIMMLNWL